MAALISSGQIRFVYKDFVLDSHRPQAQWAAEAAACAADQGKFWAYHHHLFATQQRWTKFQLRSYADELGLDAKQFAACFDSGRHTAEVQATTKEAADLGLPGTPAFTLNGKVLNVTSVPDLMARINQALGR